VTALTTWAIVVAAGTGDRLGADRPKAFVRFRDRTLVAAALEAFEEHPGIDGVVVAVPEGYEERMTLIADDLGTDKVAAAVEGGATRAESVGRALECLPDHVDFVLVHDAARPLLPGPVVDAVLGGLASGYDGVVPALPIADTVKRVAADGTVVETLDRASLRAVQTPQGFPVAVLRRAFAAAGAALGTATDCAALVEAAGGRVVCVDGDPANFKVTTAQDLTRAESLAADS
jgi:2-C-methyl-D-erythritol 4-phosphate cytidylyltransferase